MSQLLLTHHSLDRALHSRDGMLSMRVGKFFLFFSMTFLIGLLSFFYLVKFTEIHTKGYQLRKLEIERGRLLTIQESKNTDIAQLKSLNAVRESATVRSMLPMRTPIFVKQDGNIARVP